MSNHTLKGENVFKIQFVCSIMKLLEPCSNSRTMLQMLANNTDYSNTLSNIPFILEVPCRLQFYSLMKKKFRFKVLYRCSVQHVNSY